LGSNLLSLLLSLPSTRALSAGDTGGIGEEGESGRLELAYLACHAVPHWAHSRAANLPRQAWLLAPLPAPGMPRAPEREQGGSGLMAAAPAVAPPAAAPFLSISVHDWSMLPRPRRCQGQAQFSGGGGGGDGGKDREGTHGRVRVGSEGPAEGPAHVGAQQRVACRETSSDVLSQASPYVLCIWRALAAAARQGRIRSTSRLVRNFRLVAPCYNGHSLVSALLSLRLAADHLHALSIIQQVSLPPRPCPARAARVLLPWRRVVVCVCVLVLEGSLRLQAFWVAILLLLLRPPASTVACARRQ